ncbi:MAG: hypothetical protein RBG13Loki_2756 [Promethearchaeota archaeon CR_4]|nr:MAG: hypothetical protein RBG13Loki_2756 [Candidatus Lokiarchaeota archaeon CR_4]
MNCVPHADVSQFYYQVSLKLYPKEGYQVNQPLPTSTMARGLWFTMLNQVDPSLVDQLHAPNTTRPYAIQRYVEWTDTSRAPRTDRSTRQRRPFRSVTFTINLFREDILRAFQKFLLQLQDLAVPLGEHTYLAGEVGISRKSFLDLFSLSDSSQPSMTTPASNSDKPLHYLPKSYFVKFHTPTYFATTRSSFPLRFPTPEAVAGNLLRLWNTFQVGTGEIEEKPFIDWVNRGVILTSYYLCTRSYSVSKSKPVAGAVGEATYTIRESNPPFEQWLYVLFRLGEVTNLGRSRTAGAGHIRVYPSTSKLRREQQNSPISSQS